MKDVDDLVDDARDLASSGFSRGEIADELNVSRETASWLVERAGATPAEDEGPDDIHVDWSPVGRSSRRLSMVGAALADLLARRTGGTDSASGRRANDEGSTDGRETGGDRPETGGGERGDDPVDLVVGVEKAGGPLATAVARELDADLATYAPRKHQWNEGSIEGLSGGFSRNFAGVRDRECFVVDDTVTSGTTMRETVSAVRERGGEPVACGVLADKQGLDVVDGVPVHSLLQVIRVGDGE